MAKYKSNVFFCSICCDYFSDSYALKRHNKRNHKWNKFPESFKVDFKGGYVFTCKECGKINRTDIQNLGYCNDECRKIGHKKSWDKHHKSYKRAIWRNRPKNRLSKKTMHKIYYSLTVRDKSTYWKILDDLGYTTKELHNHIESQFGEGMSWDNYGDWVIDHIIPQKAFKYKSVSCPQFQTCWALGNLRPMWAKDNKIKGSKILGVSYA
jgi:hypothetical protein